MNLKERKVVIGNKNYCYSKIVILSTNKEVDKRGIYLSTAFDSILKDKLSLVDFPYGKESHKMIKQHLYFLSTDKICKGDWYYISDRKEIVQCTYCDPISRTNPYYIYCNNNETFSPNRLCFKVIASTDPSLNLPKPSDSFLEVYINSYNKNEKIEECLVEYETKQHFEADKSKRKDHSNGVYYIDSLKVTKEEITVRKIKDNWNREEVITIVNNVLKATGNQIKAVMMNIGSGEEYIEFNGKDLDKWISENI